MDKTSKDEHYNFVLCADNHEVIGTSQMYHSKQDINKEKKSVKANGLISSLYDLAKFYIQIKSLLKL
ncbi:YegP family protein [Oceaniserpentilla sp. 4NH20-0058]|uniref:YegP family protein n=1 Tax=Oceaniserpentilla sp. 4NH20-0058 TaxID=3127660 RepID=UPI003341612D